MRATAVYFSDRQLPLVYHHAMRPTDKPVLTVENYLKWYCLYLVRPDGSVEAVDFPEDGYCDHVPFPAAVLRMADERGWHVCTESMEMMIGRFMLEYKLVALEEFDAMRPA